MWVLTDSARRPVSTLPRTGRTLGRAGLTGGTVCCSCDDRGWCTHANQLFLYLAYNLGGLQPGPKSELW